MTLPNGYEMTTTFWMDFSIADAFGIPAIQDTYNRAFEEWKTNHVYLTELVVVLNYKVWQHFEANNAEFQALYDGLYYKTRDYALDNLKGEELEFFIKITD